MAEVAEQKICMASADSETKDYEEKLWLAQKQIEELKSRLSERDGEVTELKIRLSKTDVLSGCSPSLHSCSTEMRPRQAGPVSSLFLSESEVERLKKAVESLVTSNDEKDTRIKELQRSIRRSRRVDDVTGRHELMLAMEEDHPSDGSSTPSIMDTAREQRVPPVTNGHRFDHLMTPSATSTPDAQRYNPASVLPSPPSTIHSSPTPPKSPNDVKQSASDHAQATDSRTPPTRPRHLDTDQYAPSGQSSRSGHLMAPPLQLPPIMTMPGDSSTLPPPRRRKSQGQVDCDDDDEDVAPQVKDERTQQFRPIQNTSDPKKKKGIKKIFGKSKLKRSNSQEDLEGHVPVGDFKRGGVRATAGPRLGWSAEMANDPQVPFARWDSERLAMWFHEMGLNMYVGECRRMIRNGEQLLQASSQELEKELGIKNPLHRKKILLALQSIGSEINEKMNALDHNWVTRWLDDIGLPQYKDAFLDARVDGRMLHYLTVEDLLFLKVSSSLHHYSIKRGIQILRLNAFNPGCLRRRPLLDEGVIQAAPEECMLWTNHRVMEWLRTIDLSEYAPNLRGSGVHGALMVFEAAFSAELLAAILSIPASKTLLRRHLKSHFTSMVGNKVQLQKREYEATAGRMLLTPNMKIKSKKHGLFSHKRSKSETEFDSYICPMDVQGSGGEHWAQNGVARCSSESDSRDSSRNRAQKRNEKSAQEIGAYSQDIRTLTDMLARERFLEDDTVPSSNV